MSLNWVMLTQDGTGAVPLPQEKMFLTQTEVKLILDCNDSPGGYPGHSAGHYESSKGTLILSNQRIVYLAAQPTPQFKNLNVPILNFKQWKLEQPWFGANYVTGTVIPVQGGGLSRNCQLKLTFAEGAIEFTNILRSLLERMGEINEIPREYEALPAYDNGSSSGNYSSTAPPPPAPSHDDIPDDLPPQYTA
ncbi:hypothetical protein BDF20DRAFT_690175 [Mycotypha africana]|uniref:uncharacterized protein n=1 Tax=Mycotypha africana TaxID=64632 RepID=UPI0023013031|nr:uncharacterized protein BDF20DRAFT_690175 [Mycotypha africana]KAI8971627.1 hypothetical protein BDF20DRAFT_690175 [Mycotypha africana]